MQGRAFITKIGRAASTRASSSSTGVQEYQFMQRSKIPTMFFQRSLPRLPIPTILNTCSRFLGAAKPILTSEEYAETEKCVNEFREQSGIELQQLLKQHDQANKHTSYVNEPWFDMYLSDRAPLPLNYNPLLVMKNDPNQRQQLQIVRATNLLISSLRFWRSLRAGILEPEIFHLNPQKSDTEQFRRLVRLAPKAIATYVAYAFKAFPLDMSQYERIFGVSRIPKLQKDCLIGNPNARHVIIMRRGRLYAIDVLDASGSIESPQTILRRICSVLQLDAACEGEETVPIGALTTLDRNTWAQARDHLLNGVTELNRRSVNEVDTALFCLCLDTVNDPTYDEQNPVPVLKHLLAGEAKNRWFDKSVSLLVAGDGTAAVNFEHSWGDGVAVLRYFNEIYKETLNNPFVNDADFADAMQSDLTCDVRALRFVVDDLLCESVKEALQKHKLIMDSLDMRLSRYSNLNKHTCKRARVSPDAIMQLSFQLAYRRSFGRYVGSYESCSTAAFRHGRTETMRPCTLATQSFCESFLHGKHSAKELRTLITECSNMHGKLTKEAAMGQGFDRHLFGLRNMAILHEKSLPAIYSSIGYRKLNCNIISTSTLSSPALLAGAFGPVVKNGLGIAYSMQDNECGAVVTSYKDGNCDGSKFSDNLLQSFNDITQIMQA